MVNAGLRGVERIERRPVTILAVGDREHHDHDRASGIKDDARRRICALRTESPSLVTPGLRAGQCPESKAGHRFDWSRDVPGLKSRARRRYGASVLFSRSRISLPVLKNGTDFCATETCAPVRGLRPVRAGRFFTENAPKPRNSTRSPRASAAAISFEDGVDDVLDVALVEMRVLAVRDALHELGFDHR